ncbi:MAG: ComEC/Rec2 family competence protein [Bacteroidota bacterium]
MFDFAGDIRRVPVCRVLIPWLAGVLLAGAFPQPGGWLLFSVLAGTIALLWVLAERIVGHRRYSWARIAWVPAITVFLFTGLAFGRYKGEGENAACRDGVALSGTVLTPPVRKAYGLRFEIRADAVFTPDSVIATRERLTVMVDSSLRISPAPGERWLLQGTLRPLSAAPNPSSFDYRAYMAGRGITNSMQCSRTDTAIRLKPGRNNLMSLPLRVSARFTELWGGEGNGDLAVLRAITLGDKGALTEELRDSYSGAGASHVLAVSGLHVGMIWWILDRLLAFRGKRFMVRLGRSLLITAILWFYAALTGGASSVCRSVTMFSLVSLAGILSRRSSVMNTILLSALILLLLSPSRFFDTGFRLSYLAVCGIVLLQPRLAAWCRSRYRFLNRILDLITVSIAAQVFTFPLTLALFHQFPVAFILTNLVVIPLATVIVSLFVVTAPLLLAGWLTGPVTAVLCFFARLMNRWTLLVSGLPGAVAEGIPFTGETAAVVLVCVLLFAGLLIYRKAVWLILGLAGCAVGLFFLTTRKLEESRRSELLVCQFRDATVLVATCGLNSENVVLPGTYCDTAAVLRWLEQYKIERPRGCTSRTLIGLQDSIGASTGPVAIRAVAGSELIHAGGFRIYRAGKGFAPDDSTLIRTFDPDLVLVTDLPAANLPALQQIFIGVPLIIDGSAPPWISVQMDSLYPELWQTRQKGAFLLNRPVFIPCSNCGEVHD